MTYKVLPATRTDVPALAKTFIDAFHGDPVVGQIWSNVDPDVHLAYQTRQFDAHFDHAARDGNVHRKVVDENGKLVAFALWKYPHTMTAEQVAQKEEEENNAEPSPEGTNIEFRKDFFATIDQLRQKNMDETKDFLLHLLSVSPTHQRLGLGGLLVSDGLAVADERNAQTYIEASTKGLGLYLKHGWEPIDEIVMDMGDYGGKGVEVEKCLMRQPGGKGMKGDK